MELRVPLTSRTGTKEAGEIWVSMRTEDGAPGATGAGAGMGAGAAGMEVRMGLGGVCGCCCPRPSIWLTWKRRSALYTLPATQLFILCLPVPRALPQTAGITKGMAATTISKREETTGVVAGAPPAPTTPSAAYPTAAAPVAATVSGASSTHADLQPPHRFPAGLHTDCVQAPVAGPADLAAVAARLLLRPSGGDSCHWCCPRRRGSAHGARGCVRPGVLHQGKCLSAPSL